MAATFCLIGIDSGLCNSDEYLEEVICSPTECSSLTEITTKVPIMLL